MIDSKKKGQRKHTIVDCMASFTFRMLYTFISHTFTYVTIILSAIIMRLKLFHWWCSSQFNINKLHLHVNIDNENYSMILVEVKKHWIDRFFFSICFLLCFSIRRMRSRFFIRSWISTSCRTRCIFSFCHFVSFNLIEVHNAVIDCFSWRLSSGIRSN